MAHVRFAFIPLQMTLLPPASPATLQLFHVEQSPRVPRHRVFPLPDPSIRTHPRTYPHTHTLTPLLYLCPSAVDSPNGLMLSLRLCPYAVASETGPGFSPDIHTHPRTGLQPPGQALPQNTHRGARYTTTRLRSLSGIAQLSLSHPNSSPPRSSLPASTPIHPPAFTRREASRTAFSIPSTARRVTPSNRFSPPLTVVSRQAGKGWGLIIDQIPFLL